MNTLIEKECKTNSANSTPLRLEHYRCLVLNADYQPTSYLPLSAVSWDEAVTNAFLDKVDVVATYPGVTVHSSKREFEIPSVVASRRFFKNTRQVIFSKPNVWLRDEYECQYCGEGFYGSQLTFDHVVPRSAGGGTHFENISSACHPCNRKKGSIPWEQWVSPLGIKGPRRKPYAPTYHDLVEKAKKLPIIIPAESQWETFLNWKGPVYARGPVGPTTQIAGPAAPDIGDELIGF